MKLRNFFDNLYEALISGDQFTRLKESTLQMVSTCLGRYEGRKIELENELDKNKNVMEERINSIFTNMENNLKSLEPSERKRLNQEVVAELVRRFEPDTVDAVVTFVGLKRYK